MSRHSLTQRKQPTTGDQRQLFRPEQLEPDMDIAAVAIFEGTTLYERLLQAAAVLIAGYGRAEDTGKLRAAKEAWRHSSPAGLLPQWRGTVKWINEEGAMVRLTAALDNKELAPGENFVGRELHDLPLVSEPQELFSSFDVMGLAAIGSRGRISPDQAYFSERGRWHRAATLLLEP